MNLYSLLVQHVKAAVKLRKECKENCWLWIFSQQFFVLNSSINYSIQSHKYTKKRDSIESISVASDYAIQ